MKIKNIKVLLVFKNQINYTLFLQIINNTFNFCVYIEDHPKKIYFNINAKIECIIYNLQKKEYNLFDF